MRMMKTRVVIVSATGTGRKRTLPQIIDSDLEVVAIHGRNEAKIAELAAHFAIPAHFTDLEQMVDIARPDFAVVCSPPFMHAEQTTYLLNAGVPVLIEKPISISLEDANTIREASIKSGLPVRIAHHLRHQNTYRRIRSAVESGELGRVVSVLAEWSFKLNPDAPSSIWKLDSTVSGVSCINDAGIHCLDTLQGIFGEGDAVAAIANKINGSSTFEEVTALIKYSEVPAVLLSARTYGPRNNDFIINGTEGSIVAKNFFTESSSSIVELVVNGQLHRIEHTSPNPYRQEVIDFASVVNGLVPEYDDTSIDDAIASLNVAARLDSIITNS